MGPSRENAGRIAKKKHRKKKEREGVLVIRKQEAARVDDGSTGLSNSRSFIDLWSLSLFI